MENCISRQLKTGSPDLITDIGISAVYVFYVLAFAGLVKLRKKKIGETLAEYRVPFYPITPALAVVGGLYIITSTIQNQTLYAFYALIVTLAGLPVYWFVSKKKHAMRSEFAG